MYGYYQDESISFSDFVMKFAGAYSILDRCEKDIYKHRELLEDAESDVTRIEAWDDNEADRQAQLAYDRVQREEEKWRTEHKAKLEHYNTRLVQVKAWTPFNPRVKLLKIRIVAELEDLRAGLLYDEGPVLDKCKGPYNPNRLAGEAYKAQELDSARERVCSLTKSIKFYEKYFADIHIWYLILLQSLILVEGSDPAVEA